MDEERARGSSPARLHGSRGYAAQSHDLIDLRVLANSIPPKLRTSQASGFQHRSTVGSWGITQGGAAKNDIRKRDRHLLTNRVQNAWNIPRVEASDPGKAGGTRSPQAAEYQVH